MFKNRIVAGDELAQEFSHKISSIKDLVVVGIAGGGVPIASRIAERLDKKLDVLSIKKIITTKKPIQTLGAVSEEGDLFLEHNAIFKYNIGSEELKLLIDKYHGRARSESEIFMSDKRFVDYEDKSILLVDDGIATGSTIQAAVMFFKKYNVKQILLASPVCSRDAWDVLHGILDSIFVLDIQKVSSTISNSYEEFLPVSNEDVIGILLSSPTALNSKKMIEKFDNLPTDIFHFY